jgi:hypothetical protein
LTRFGKGREPFQKEKKERNQKEEKERNSKKMQQIKKKF